MADGAKPDDVERQLTSLRNRVAQSESMITVLVGALTRHGVALPMDEIRRIRYSSEKALQKPSIHRLIGQTNNERGDWAERTTHDVANTLPDAGEIGVLSARRATYEEDQAGTDVFVETVYGTVPLQVKSSKAGADSALSKRESSVVFPLVMVISPAMSLDRIHAIVRGKILFGIGHLRSLKKAKKA